ncbi:L-threonine 3-dehydrogenase [Paraburkholderia phytofirmans]
MRALVKAERTAGLWLQEVSDPVPADDEVLIRIRKTGIGDTELRIWNWGDWAQHTIRVPLVIGREYAGEIVQVGRNVRYLRTGMRVSGQGSSSDCNASAVRTGRVHACADSGVVGITRSGAFAEYLSLPALGVIELPDEVDDELGAILDPLGNATHVALSFDLIGEDVLITGAGPIGIMAATIARHVGARNIVMSDVNATRLALAREVADVVTVDPSTASLADVMQQLRIIDGFAVGFEMSGNTAAMQQLVGSMAMGGRIASVGLPAEKFNVDWRRIVRKGLVIKGIYGRDMLETRRKMLNLLSEGLDVRGIITHRLAADNYKEGFSALQSGNAGKVVLTWAD